MAEGGALRALDLEGRPIVSSHNHRLQRLSEPAPIEPRLHLRGQFVYMADAAHIVLCENGQPLPVAMEADYRALERAYLAAGPQPAQRLLVNLEGQIALRPDAEADRPPVQTLVVERFIGIHPRERCASPGARSPAARPSLTGTYWRLVQLDDQPVPPGGPGKREAMLTLDLQARRISGTGCCNRFNGTVNADGDHIRVSELVSTRMACAEAMATEAAFFKALEGAVMGTGTASQHRQPAGLLLHQHRAATSPDEPALVACRRELGGRLAGALRAPAQLLRPWAGGRRPDPPRHGAAGGPGANTWNFRLPRAFWKLIVARGADGSLASTAFWLDQEQSLAARSTVPDLDAWRIDVPTLEARSGLDFETTLRHCLPLQARVVPCHLHADGGP